MFDAHRGQKRASDSLELGAGDPMQAGPLEKQHVLLPLSHLSAPLFGALIVEVVTWLYMMKLH